MSGQPPQPFARRWRGYLRVSVRSLVVFVLVVGGVLGWIVRGARIQRDAVAAITQAGGEVFYDWQFRDGRLAPHGNPPAPSWLVDAFGVDYFGHVAVVDLQLAATSAHLAHIGRLSRLKHLNLAGSSLSDADIADLSGLSDLTSLKLSSTPISDAGFSVAPGLAAPGKSLHIASMSYRFVRKDQLPSNRAVRYTDLSNTTSSVRPHTRPVCPVRAFA
jgi:Leucine-rich repeat (LRR) protein